MPNNARRIKTGELRLKQALRKRKANTPAEMDMPFDVIVLAQLRQIRRDVRNLESIIIQRLHFAISESFDTQELKHLALALAIDYDNLNGRRKSEKITDLLRYCDNTGQLPALMTTLRELRPNVF